MKTFKPTIVLAIVIFVSLTLLTMKHEASSDGVGAYGFPFTFYDYFEGKCDNCYSNFGLKPFYLLVDISFSFVLGFLVTILKRKFSK